MCHADTPPHFEATSSGGDPPVRLLAICSCLPRPPFTDASAPLQPAAVTCASAWLRVAEMLLPLSWPLFGLERCVDCCDTVPSGWGTCVFGAFAWGSAVTGGAAAPPRLRRPRDVRRGPRRGCAAQPPPRTLTLPARGGSCHYGFLLFGATSPLRHPPTIPPPGRRRP